MSLREKLKLSSPSKRISAGLAFEVTETGELLERVRIRRSSSLHVYQEILEKFCTLSSEKVVYAQYQVIHPPRQRAITMQPLLSAARKNEDQFLGESLLTGPDDPFENMINSVVALSHDSIVQFALALLKWHYSYLQHSEEHREKVQRSLRSRLHSMRATRCVH
jgi:hypothetical protein